MDIGCYAKHNDPFFDRCCHPLQKGTQPEPACQPSSGADGDSDNDSDNDCEDDDSSLTSAPTTSPTTTTASPVTTEASPVTTKASPDTTSHSSSAAKAKATDAAAAEDANVTVDTSVVTGGVATFFYQGGNAGACGKVNSDDALVAAMDSRTYGNTSRKSPLCGKKVEITNTKNHKKVVVTVADACPTCKNKNSIDLSVHAFKTIATETEGEVPITWRFL
jgi:rare lipoprotein A (peptidoglycan hydrolase)